MKDELLALLEEGPRGPSELAAILKADTLTVIRTLKRMKAEGLTWRTDYQDGSSRWSLAGVSAGGLLSKAQPPRPAKATKTLRAPHERPPSAPYTEDRSWWCGLDRDAFQAEAAKRVLAMMGSKQAMQVANRMLQ